MLKKPDPGAASVLEAGAGPTHGLDGEAVKALLQGAVCASFQGIRTRLRGELAGAYLLASDVPVTAIGLALGFSEPGSFSRSSFAWAGMAPSAYRAEYIGDSAKVAAATALLRERRIS